jgi:hypothetical protein
MQTPPMAAPRGPLTDFLYPSRHTRSRSSLSRINFLNSQKSHRAPGALSRRYDTGGQVRTGINHSKLGMCGQRRPNLSRLVVSLSVLSLFSLYSMMRLFFGDASTPEANGLTAPNCEERDFVCRKRFRIYTPNGQVENGKRIGVDATHLFGVVFSSRPYFCHRRFFVLTQPETFQ